jgi:hypothetical protein
MRQDYFMPGELVISLDQRSPLNSAYFDFWKDQYSAFHEVIQTRKQMNKEGTKGENPVKKA